MERYKDKAGFTVQTIRMPSVSSGVRILIWEVPFSVCSVSDIPIEQQNYQNFAFILHTNHFTTIYCCSDLWCPHINHLHRGINMDNFSRVPILDKQMNKTSTDSVEKCAALKNSCRTIQHLYKRASAAAVSKRKHTHTYNCSNTPVFNCLLLVINYYLLRQLT